MALCSVLVGCSNVNLGELPTDTVLAAYVVLGEAGSGEAQAHARVIVSGTSESCPELSREDGDAPARSMTFRDNPHGFVVKVCEALIPFGERTTVSWNGQPLPAATMHPEHVLLFGDTGCKAKDCSGDSPAKPFVDLADDASTITPQPDVIVHVGDYNYRGTPGVVNGDANLPVYDGGDETNLPSCGLDRPYVSQNAGYSEAPDSWEMWRVDFFEPAGDLLGTAPLVAARGNHELCSRAGPGWFYFLDTSSNLDGGTQLACPPQGGSTPPVGDVLSHVVFIPPRAIDLGTLRLVVLDSASACDGFAPPATVDIYADQFRSVLPGIEDDTPTWVVSHRPFWGVDKLCSEDEDAACTRETINHTLQAALAQAESEGHALPANLRLFVSGHMHLFQSLTFAPIAPETRPRPPQIVVGNGGVETASGPGDGFFSTIVDGAPTRGFTSTTHGFTTIPVLSPDGSWRGEVVNPHKGETLALCGQPVEDRSLCNPPSP